MARGKVKFDHIKISYHFNGKLVTYSELMGNDKVCTVKQLVDAGENLFKAICTASYMYAVAHLKSDAGDI